MNVRAVTWNIGGGKSLRPGEDPTRMSSYSIDAIGHISQKLKQINPDIVTLQEAHGDDSGNQPSEIAEHLGYDYSVFDATSDSFIEDGKQMGNGVISRYPMVSHQSGVFHNPNIRAVIQDREIVTHDKGYSSCVVRMGGVALEVTSLHLLPFKALDIEPGSDVWEKIVASYVDRVESDERHRLIGGDFNIDSSALGSVDSRLLTGRGLGETILDSPTTPSDRHYDRLLFAGLALRRLEIDSLVKTDHYPVIADFQLKTSS